MLNEREISGNAQANKMPVFVLNNDTGVHSTASDVGHACMRRSPFTFNRRPGGK
jgi:hypothetical protein